MQKIVKLVNEGPQSRRHDDDLSDRLNSRYTVLFLVVFTVVVSSQMYIGKPISCWCPKQFHGAWVKYTNNYCWVRNTYHLPLVKPIPRSELGQRENRELQYYQWLPFILLVQALGFYLPSVIWHAFNQKSGVDCDNILAASHKYHYTAEDKPRQRLLRLTTNQIKRFLTFPNIKHESNLEACFRKLCCCICSVAHGKYLVMLYILSKIFYIFNIVAQFYILNIILGNNYFYYGYNIVKDFITGDYTNSLAAFPRVTMCDFKMRRLGNIHGYTVQCVLPVNMYSEKIFAFLWFWMMIVGVYSALSFCQWTTRFLSYQDKYNYIRYHLNNSPIKLHTFKDPHRQKHALADFVDSFLKPDGVFVLQLIGHNTNNMTVCDIVSGVWNEWVVVEKRMIEKEHEIV